MEEDMKIEIAPKNWVTSDSTIKVIGVGGGGCNAVNYMFEKGIHGCSFIVCNTDAQALAGSNVPTKVQMGRGLGAGTDPVKGRNAALESQQDILDKALDADTEMVFITAGMGGGTGTGAAPVIARMAKEKGILTVGVVTLPFKSEGQEIASRALEGVSELEKNVDSLLVINNEKLYAYYGNLLVQDAFPKVDEVLATAVSTILEIIKTSGEINVDFQDVKNMMLNSGVALMGIGSGSGADRINDAVKEAFESPLLNNVDVKTAKKVLINITVPKSDKGVTMTELGQINSKIAEYTGGSNNFKTGMRLEEDPEFGDTVRITAIATGLRFDVIFENEIEQSNIIAITKDFVYDKKSLSKGDGISLDIAGGNFRRQRVGFNTQSVKGTYVYDADEKCALLSTDEQEILELENTPSIRRIQK